jgi:hypothetical protein
LSKDLLLSFGVVISRHAARACRLCQLQFKRRLDLKPTFYLYRNVPEVDSGALQRAIGQTTQDGAVAFATTHWSVVLTAQGESSAAQEALEKLCRTYWRPGDLFMVPNFMLSETRSQSGLRLDGTRIRGPV